MKKSQEYCHVCKNLTSNFLCPGCRRTTCHSCLKKEQRTKLVPRGKWEDPVKEVYFEYYCPTCSFSMTSFAHQTSNMNSLFSKSPVPSLSLNPRQALFIFILVPVVIWLFKQIG
ncbi:hypothetical protein [Candidatus Uabimicrobium amorphum]|uniref:Uncharacterized protein n=1 Tax=Uabimicrobium amorphum TaxID=2596890 RepID=A0A5S9F5H1_UABAM|nr:hypothetical protein [Candidatus Uabimicrobium amorphum]BBM86857.1 hypothetical protein UABAM_05257 [Candidatus Uabimicrobium amorphum]